MGDCRRFNGKVACAIFGEQLIFIAFNGKGAAVMDTLLEKVKANLILEHSADDALLQGYITAAVSYAESYQHIQEG